MFLSELAIRRPILAAVANLLIMVIGIGALLRLPVRQYPNVDPPVVTISATWLGASAAVVETEISKRIEEAVAGIEGLRLLTAASRDEGAQIELEFRLDRDLEFAAADVRDQLARIRKLLPETADEPVVIKASASSTPIMWISLVSARRDQRELSDLIRRALVDRLSVVPGVASVMVGGERRYAMRVWLDPDALSARGLTAADVVRRLGEENLELPAGRLESAQREMTVRTSTRLSTPDEFRALVLRDPGGAAVRLGEVARVELGAESERSGVWVGGKPAVGMGIVRQSTANSLAVGRGVRAALAELAPRIPADVVVSFPYDESVFIAASIDEVRDAMLLALALVVGVILLFLRAWRATLVPALAIPVSLVATFAVMQGFGFSLNVLTLLALVLAIGLVVDDAIVVLENIHRRMELGEPRLLAASRGTREVGFAVVATTLVLAAVFIPVSFMAGTTGALFREFGVTMAAAVLFSGFTALTLTPVLCSRLLRLHDGEGALGARIESAHRGIAAAYRAALDVALAHRAAALVLAGAVVALGVLMFLRVPRELAPSEDRGFVIGVLEAPQGATLDYTFARVREAEAVLAPYRAENGGPVTAVLTIVAPSFAGPSSPNSAFMIVRLKDWQERKASQQQLVAEVQRRLFALPGAFAFAVSPPGFGQRGLGQQLQVAVGAERIEDSRAWAGELLGAMRARPDLFAMPRDLNTDLTRPQLLVTVDRARAAQLGISVRDIGDTLQLLLGETKVTRIEDRSQQYEVMVRADGPFRRAPDDLARFRVRAADGALVPLSDLASWRETGAPKELNRTDRMASVAVGAGLMPGASMGTAVAWIQGAAAARLPPQARLTWLGEAREYRESAGGAASTFGLALLVVFLVLAAQFESWIHPAIIMTAVPLAAAGALAALLATGQSLNIYSQIGLVMLVGMMAKNGILVVEFANQLRDRGRDVLAAAREAAAIRLRPILMTSIATIAGAVPLALAAGAGAEGRRAIGWVVVGGMALATLLTLFVVPVLYSLLARFTASAGAASAELEREERENPVVDRGPA